uniref:Uncharacterized protein n=1 Tax=Ananas comosus var. bracteatus TaxID=296719 RepID=A0A6V7NTA9_ANACO|nr:unnamed protein product [Ananas comosus var. bracteatus]
MLLGPSTFHLLHSPYWAFCALRDRSPRPGTGPESSPRYHAFGNRSLPETGPRETGSSRRDRSPRAHLAGLSQFWLFLTDVAGWDRSLPCQGPVASATPQPSADGTARLLQGTTTSVSGVGRYLQNYTLASRYSAAHERPENPKTTWGENQLHGSQWVRPPKGKARPIGFLYPNEANHTTRLRVNHPRIIRALAAHQPTALSVSAP